VIQRGRGRTFPGKRCGPLSDQLRLGNLALHRTQQPGHRLLDTPGELVDIGRRVVVSSDPEDELVGVADDRDSTWVNRGTLRIRSAIAAISESPSGTGPSMIEMPPTARLTCRSESSASRNPELIDAPSCRPIAKDENRAVGVAEPLSHLRCGDLRDEVGMIGADDDQLIDVCALFEQVGYVV
jgi:hypothetical protein